MKIMMIWYRMKIFLNACPFGKFQTKAVYQRSDYHMIDSKAEILYDTCTGLTG